MAIITSEIVYYLSGATADGLSQTDPNASLGNYRSGTAFTSGSLHNLFDQVSGDEASAGDVEYRCLAVKNENASLTLQNAVVWITSQTPSTDTTIEIAVEAPSSQPDGNVQEIADEDTAPSALSFSAPTSKATGVSIGDLAAGNIYYIWIRRTVGAAASAYDNDNVQLRVEGDTAA